MIFLPVMMTLQGESKLFRHGKADTMYVTIPAAIVKDSAFTFIEGQQVDVRFDPETKTVVISSRVRVHTNTRDKP